MHATLTEQVATPASVVREVNKPCRRSSQPTSKRSRSAGVPPAEAGHLAPAISVTPAAVALTNLGSQQFTAVVTGGSNSVNWWLPRWPRPVSKQEPSKSWS